MVLANDDHFYLAFVPSAAGDIGIGTLRGHSRRDWMNRAAKQHLQLIKKTERETEPKWHLQHARDNQLQVGSRGDPI